jgi:hypothetical protein
MSQPEQGQPDDGMAEAAERYAEFCHRRFHSGPYGRGGFSWEGLPDDLRARKVASARGQLEEAARFLPPAVGLTVEVREALEQLVAAADMEIERGEMCDFQAAFMDVFDESLAAVSEGPTPDGGDDAQ